MHNNTIFLLALCIAWAPAAYVIHLIGWNGIHPKAYWYLIGLSMLTVGFVLHIIRDIRHRNILKPYD